MTKAVIFDMDGVLFDTEPIYYEKRRSFFEQQRVEISREELLKCAGLHYLYSFPVILARLGEQRLDELMKAYGKYHYETPTLYTKSMNKNVVEILTYLKGKGYLLAVASSSPRHKIDDAMSITGIKSFFNITVSGEMFKESKPNPEIYEYTVSQLAIDKKNIIVVEDSNYGIQAAKAANLRVVCKVDNRFAYDQCGCDYYINDLLEIKNIL